MMQSACAHITKRAFFLVPVVALCAVFCAFNTSTLAWADPDPLAEKQAEAQAALQSLNTMLAELDAANEDYAAALGKQEQAKNLVKQTQKRIDIQTEAIQNLQLQLGSRVRSMYRMGTSSFLDVLFGSTTFINFATNWDLLSNMNAEDADLVRTTKAERDKLDEMRALQMQQQHEADEAAQEAQRIRDKANETAKRMQETYESLSAEAEELLAQRQAELAAAAAAQAAAEAAAAAQAQAQAQAQVATYAEANAAGGGTDAGAGQAIAMDDITNFDEATGTATLSDGTQAKVTGYDLNTGNAIVDLASQFVGGNYGWGAQDPTTSTFDCSGLVQYVYQQNGIEVGGHNDRAILDAGNVISSSEAQAGDILWWEGHVAIYAGDGMMISADNEQYGITYREVSDGATYVRY